MNTVQEWTRARLDAFERTPLAPGSAVKPAVWRVLGEPGAARARGAQVELVVKDIGHQRAPGSWLGRWLLARERRALEQLVGVRGVPQLAFRVGREAIGFDLMAGRTVDREAVLADPRGFLERLCELTERVHARGVFHMDLQQRKNLLIEPDGSLAMIDFGAAFVPGPLARAAFGRWLARVDRQAPLKFLARFAPESLSPSEARAVLRQRRLRRLWPFGRPSRREERGARERLNG